MYVAVIPNRGSPPAVLLRESYRESGKTKNRTLANLSGWPPERVEQLRAVLRGETSLEQARAAIQQATRRYAKRQLTWFRKEAGVHWLLGFGDDPQIQNAVLSHLQVNLAEPA